MTLPPLNVTAAEAAAIAVALAARRTMPFGEAGRSALRKIVAAMAAGSRRGAEDLAGRIHLLTTSDAPEVAGHDVLRTVERALAERLVLRLTYVDRDGAVTRDRVVEPAALIGGERAWYLVGWCRLRDAGRAFRLDRMRSAALTGEVAPERRLEDVAAGLVDWVRVLSL